MSCNSFTIYLPIPRAFLSVTVWQWEHNKSCTWSTLRWLSALWGLATEEWPVWKINHFRPFQFTHTTVGGWNIFEENVMEIEITVASWGVWQCYLPLYVLSRYGKLHSNGRCSQRNSLNRGRSQTPRFVCISIFSPSPLCLLCRPLAG